MEDYIAIIENVNVNPEKNADVLRDIQEMIKKYNIKCVIK